jgi:amino acid adenylation domain-containing protein/FkbM family methyltransferase
LSAAGSGAAPELEGYASLPLEAHRSQVFSGRLASAELSLTNAAIEGSQGGARLVAAIALILARYTGLSKISIGLCSGGFAAAMPVATPHGISLGDLLADVGASLADLVLDRASFSDQVSALGLEAVTNRNPLFGVMVALDDSECPALRQDACVRLNVAARSLIVDYNSRLFRPEIVSHFLGHLSAALDALLNSSEQPLGSVDILGAAERLQLQAFVHGGNPRFAGTIWDQLLVALERDPDAIVLDDHGTSWSLGQLTRRAGAIVEALAGRAAPGARLGIALTPGPDQIAALLAAVLARAVLVPLDISLPAARQDAIRLDADLAAVITDAALAERFAEYNPLVVEGLPDSGDMPALRGVPSADDPLYLLFTSGSTGRPKGVLVPNRTLANLVAWEDGQRQAMGKRTLGRTSIAFDVGLQEIFATILFGGTLVVASDEERADIGNLGRLLAKRRISRIYLPPVALHQMAESADLDSLDLHRLDHVIVAGERLVVSQAIRRFFRSADAVLVNQYGPTETHVATEAIMTGSPLRWPDLPPIGRPIAGVEIELVDAGLAPVPLLVPGEVLIGGVAPALGYAPEPLSGSEAFMASPADPDGVARVYRTGDWARWRADGELEFIGRADDQVKIRGYRVELGDLEANASSIAGVQNAVAKYWASTAWTGLALYVVLDPEDPPSLADLRSALRARVPDYMLPPLHAIQAMAALPLTATGKVDRAQLPEPAGAEGAVAGAQDVAGRLEAIWANRLGLSTVGPEEDFLDLGGHSLLAIQIVSEVNDEFDVGVPLSSLLRGATLGQFTARVLSLTPAATAPDAQPAAINGAQPSRIGSVTIGDLVIAAPSPSEARHLWREVFDERAYAPPQISYEKGSTVIDVGANIGIFSRFALSETGGCRIVAIEPAEELFECLSRNLGAAPEVVALRLGCGARDEDATLSYFPQVPAMSSFEPNAAKDGSLLRDLLANDPVWAAAGNSAQQASFLEGAFARQEQSCTLRRLSSLIRQMNLARIDLLKIDVQRGEASVLAGIDDDHWTRVRQIVVELQDEAGAVSSMTDLLKGRGFSVETAAIPLHRGTDVRFVYARRA